MYWFRARGYLWGGGGQIWKLSHENAVFFEANLPDLGPEKDKWHLAAPKSHISEVFPMFFFGLLDTQLPKVTRVMKLVKFDPPKTIKAGKNAKRTNRTNFTWPLVTLKVAEDLSH